VVSSVQSCINTYNKDPAEDFKGVLVANFYAAYRAIQCPQQKCWFTSFGIRKR